MSARIFELRRKNQVNLDDVLPGLREKYSDEPVYVEADLFEILKQFHDDDLGGEMEDILSYFFENDGPTMLVRGGNLPEGEEIEFFLDDNLDEGENKYYMILMRKPKE